MQLGKQLAMRLVSALFLAFLLVGCYSESPNDGASGGGTGAEFQLPRQLTALRLSDNGSIRAYVRIDGGPRQAMTISGTSASLDLELEEGDHMVTIILEFVLDSDPGNPVLLAESTKPLTVSTSGSNSLGFSDSDFDFSSYDDDGDGISNLAEMQSPQISEVRTNGGTTTPSLAFNSAGDGIAVWEVGGIGRNLLYSVYDSTTDTWSTEAVFRSASYNSGMSPQLVSNGTGFALVWREYDGSKNDLLGSFFDGSSWSSIVNIEALDTSISSHSLASNGTGYAVTWYQSDETQNRVYASISSTGTTWGGAVAIDTATNSATSPKIASNGTGYAVAWRQDDRAGVSLYTGTWSAPTLVDTAATYSPTSVQIASNGSGYSVLWRKTFYDGANFYANIWSNTYYDNGGTFVWTGEQDIDIGTAEYAYLDSASAITTDGTGYGMTFRVNDGSGNSDIYARFKADGASAWGGATSLENDPGFTYSPTIRSNGNGYAVVWSQYDGSSTYDLKANVYASGSWSGDQGLETGSAPVYTSYQFDGIGSEYAVAWPQEVSGTSSLFANVYSSGNWGLVQELEAGAGRVSSRPTVAASPDGSIAVAWTQTGLGASVNRYQSNTWSGELALSTTSFGGSSVDPFLVNNGNGRILALWRQDVGGNNVLYANIRKDGIWGQPEALSDSSYDVYSGSLHAASNGNGFAVAWVQGNGGGGGQSSVFARVYDGDTSSWNSAEEVDDPAITESANLVYNGYGNALASNGTTYMLVYWQFDGTAYNNIYAREYDGSAWSAPQELDDPAIDNSASNGVVASDGSGYMAAWNHYDSSYNFYGAEFTSGAWSATQLIVSGGATGYFYSSTPRLVSDGYKYLAVWSQYDGSIYRARGNLYSGGSWGAYSNLDTASGYNVYSYPIALATDDSSDVDGGFVVAWAEYANGPYTVTANIYDGTTWLGAVNVDDGASGTNSFDSSNTAFRTPLASSGGDFGVVWRRYDGSTYYDAYASLYSGASWSAPELLEAADANISDLQLAGAGDGGFMAAWRHEGSGIYDVYFNRYDSGTWGGEILLDDNDNSGAFNLSLSADPDDGYMATWIQAEPTGDPAVGYPFAMIGF